MQAKGSCNQCGKCCEKIRLGKSTKTSFKEGMNGRYIRLEGARTIPQSFTETDDMFILTQMIEITTNDDHYFLCPFYDGTLKMCLIQQIPTGKPHVCADYPYYNHEKVDINNLMEGCGFAIGES